MTPHPRSRRDGELADLLGSLPRVAPPPALRGRVLAAFDARERGDAPPVRATGRLLWLRPALIGAAAAAAAVFVLGPGPARPGGEAPHATRWVTIADVPAVASTPIRFVDDPSLPFHLTTAGPLDGP